MKVYTDATIAKDLLLQFQGYVKTFSKVGPTDLTVYAENFAAQLMEIYYGYPFINMNYATKNIAGIDLLNKENDHGVQFTLQDNSTEKIQNSIKKSKEYSKLTVFFFNPNKVDTIVKHVKEKSEWKENVEVISLINIFSSIEQDPSKATQYKDLCELWIDGDTSTNTDLINRLNHEAQKRIESNIRSKKYIPEIYIPEDKLKSNCRVFADPFWATHVFLYKIPTYFTGYCYELIKHVNFQLEDGTKISYQSDCDVSNYFSQKYPELRINEIIDKIKNYLCITESTFNGTKIFDENNKELSVNEKHSNFENGVSFTIKYDLEEYEYSEKKFFFIVKDAGQGKTSFLCDFASNVLLKRHIPTIYLNVNELTKNLLETVKEQLSLSIGKGFDKSFHILEQYCYVTNKKLIICIDGLNEKDNLSEFRKELLELFRFVDANDFIKVIATSRNKAYQTYFKDFSVESFGDLIEQNIEENYQLHGRKTKHFQKRLYEKYRKHFNILCYVSSDARQKLSNDTLLLRLFCEVFENNTGSTVNDIYLYDLFDSYIKKRGLQLLKFGKIKREDDLVNLLFKISRKMIETHNLNDFSYEGFSSDEKDLIDIVVQEDIIIKSSDENGINRFGGKSSFSFTYDEFRDFLLANTVLMLNNSDFDEELKTICNESERYEGVLKFIFLFCKTRNDDKILSLKKYPIFVKLYSENIFSIEDRFLSTEDVEIIKKALKNPKNKYVYQQVVKRLDVSQYINLSVENIVSVYIDTFLGSTKWKEIFFDYNNYYGEESGLLPELLRFKLQDTREQEVYGILLLLCTMSVSSEIIEKFLVWLREKYEKAYIDALRKIMQNRSELFDKAKYFLNLR